MGTRADFYVGRGEQAEWLGSIAYDGYPDGVLDLSVSGDSKYLPVVAYSETGWRVAVAEFLAPRDDATEVDQGWPWPWDDSQTTDYAYAWDNDEVFVSSFGHAWFPIDALPPEDDDEDSALHEGAKVATFPNMKDRQNVAWDNRSGLPGTRAAFTCRRL